MRFFVFVILITVTVYVYIGIRIIIPSHFSKWLKRLLWVIQFILFFLPIIAFILRIFKIGDSWRDNFSWVAYVSFGFFSILFVLLITRDIIRAISKIVCFITAHLTSGRKKSVKLSITPDYLEEHAAAITRKRFITNTVNAGVLGLSGIMTLTGIKEARQVPSVEKISIPLNNLPVGFSNFRIAQISDIHIGPTIKKGFVETIISEVNKLKCDAVVITGDLADGDVKQLKHDAAPVKNLKAKHGVYFVTGNHEYYSGVFQWIDFVSSLGIIVLNNDHKSINVGKHSLIMAGVTDYSAGNMIPAHKTNPKNALMGAPDNCVKLLLAHQPQSIFEASQLGYDLVLSGHTHGGQYYPWNILVSLVQPYLKGLHLHKRTWLYVNRGTGYWGPPIRIGVPPEITEITLKKV